MRRFHREDAEAGGPAADGRAGALADACALPLDDRELLGQLFRELEPRLLAVAQRMTRHPEVARDVVQSAFEKALRHGRGFRGGSRVSTWIHRIVTNEALMWLRQQRRRGEVQPQAPFPPPGLAGDGGADRTPDAVDPGPGTVERLLAREREQSLRRGLAALGADERDVVVRCGLAGESYSVYARRRGLHPAAVKSRAFRARRRLASLLAEGAHRPSRP